MINIENNLIFIRVPKTASTSMGSISFIGDGPHLYAMEIKRFMQRQITGMTWESAFKFGFVRNPWDRMVSGYFYKYEKDNIDDIDGFNRFVEQINPNGLHRRFFLPQQWRYLCDRRKNILVDYIGRYENIEEDWKNICSRIGKYEELPVMKIGKHRPYCEYYADKSKQIVADIYKDDIEMFGYKY